MVIPAIGGRELKLAELDPEDGLNRVSWHPGGKWVATVDRSSGRGPDAICIVSVPDGGKRTLMPDSKDSDTSPAFAPDGKSIVFARNNNDLYVLELNEDLTPRNAPRRLTFDNVYAHDATWMPDGRSVLYSKGSPHSPGLWRVWVQPTGSEPRTPELIPGAGAGVKLRPAVSRTGRLAFVTGISNTDIWRVDLTKRGGGRRGSEIGVRPAVASPRLDHTVKFSPDGKRLAFASERSGTYEIWVSTTDGKDAMKLTSFGGPYTTSPSWSPDGRWISFGSVSAEGSAVYMVPAEGGEIKRLTDPKLNADGGSWTPDGQWIYCGFSGQLGKVPVAGGSPRQITRNGGRTPAETPDGRVVYYLKDDSLWTVPADGGEERQVLPSVFANNFVVRKDGIYFIPSPKPAIWFFSFADRKTSMLAALRSPPAYGMDVSKDGKVAMVPEYVEASSNITMIENFR